MDPVTVPAMCRAKGGRIRQHIVSGALLGLSFAVVSCGGGDDGGVAGGGGGGNPPPGGSATQFAYVINAGDTQIQAYRSDAGGALTPIGSPLGTGGLPHHVDVDPAGRFVYVSNHDSTFLSGYRINQDGTLAPMSSAPGSPVTGTDPTENESHSSVIDRTGQFLYVVAGTNASTLRAYRIDTTPGNTLGLPTFIQGQSFPVGIHAHNIAMSPNNQFVYVACDNPTGEVHAFSRDTSTGALTPVGVVTGLPNATAVAVDPQSRFVYVTYTNAVEVFQIGANGALTRITPVSTFPTDQSGPHSLAMHPNGQTLYVANINSNTISVFRVDAATGVLTPIQLSPRPTTGGDPNYVAIHPNGTTLYTADANNPGLDQVSRFTINADGTLTSAGTIQTGNGTNGIGITRL